MVITLLLDPQWHGVGQMLARVFIGPPFFLLVVWIGMRGWRMLRSEYGEDRKTEWTLLVLAAVLAAAFLFATRQPHWT